MDTVSFKLQSVSVEDRNFQDLRKGSTIEAVRRVWGGDGSRCYVNGQPRGDGYVLQYDGDCDNVVIIDGAVFDLLRDLGVLQ